MPDDTISISFEADETGLAQAIEAAKAQLAGLDQAAIATGQKIAAGLKGLGVTPAAGFKMMGPEDQQNLAAYMASLDKVKASAGGADQALKNMGGSVTTVGINIGNMIERMAVRMAIMETFRLAIRGIGEVIQIVQNFEEAKRQVDLFSDSAEHAARNFTLLQQASEQIKMPIQATEAGAAVLESYGMAADAAIVKMESLGKAAQFLTTNAKDAEAMAKRLAEAYGRLDIGTESVQDMRLLAMATGTAYAENEKLVNSYAEFERQAPIAIKRIDTELRNLEATERRTQQQREEADRVAERSEDRRLTAIEKLAQAQQKGLLTPGTAQERLYQALGIPTAGGMPRDPLTAAFEQAARFGAGTQAGAMQALLRGGGGVGPTGQPIAAGGAPGALGQMLDPQMIARYQQGIQALSQELAITPQNLQRLVGQGVFNYSDVMRAGKEAHQDQMEAIRFTNQQQMEDQRQRADAQKQGIVEQGQRMREATEASLRVGTAAGAPGVQKAFGDWLNSWSGQTAQLGSGIQQGIKEMTTKLGEIAESSSTASTHMGKVAEILGSGGT